MARILALINPSLSTQNVGDLFIDDSLKRILDYDRDHSVEIDPRRPISTADIDRINSCEAAVIMGTNLWYRNMACPGRWMFTAKQLRQVRVPIIPIGVGTTRHDGEDNGFQADTLEQLRIIHASCEVGSVRDPRTAEALDQSGIRNIRMTGCPTIFRSLSPTWSQRPASSTKQVVVTVRKGQRDNVRRLISILRERGLSPIIAAQQDKDLFLKRWIPFWQSPVSTLYEYSLAPYRQLVEDSLGAIGWRLHGNMLHLAHGNPAILVSNCSRGDSFCDAFSLPRRRCEDHCRLDTAALNELVDLLLSPGTFAQLAARYVEHRASLVKFLEANQLAHRLHSAAEGSPRISKAASGHRVFDDSMCLL